MTIFNTQVQIYYSQSFGNMYYCLKTSGKNIGSVVYATSIWEVIQFILT